VNELIAVVGRAIGAEQVQTVNARDLHAFLGLSRDFNQWLREQIERARLVAGRDYLSYEDVGKPTGGRPRREYALTLEAAKHIAMVSGTEMGFQVREYFIECERHAKQAVRPVIPQTLPEALRLAADEAEKRAAAEAQLAIAAPKVAALDRIAIAGGSLCVTDAAKALQIRPVDLFHWLSSNQWAYRRPGASHWIGYQSRLQQGLLEHKVTTVRRNDGSDKVTEQVRITPKGLAKIAEALACLETA
jgi:anti-repressor protein